LAWGRVAFTKAVYAVAQFIRAKDLCHQMAAGPAEDSLVPWALTS